MSKITFSAEPYPLEADTESTALIIIDMQRDFLEEGGFGAMLGNDVSVLRSTIEPCKRLLEAARANKLLVIHILGHLLHVQLYEHILLLLHPLQVTF